MPRRQNTNRKNVSKGKPTVKAFKAPSPSPRSGARFPLGEGAGMRTPACARTHTHIHTHRDHRVGPCAQSQHQAASLGPGTSTQPQGMSPCRAGRPPAEPGHGYNRGGQHGPRAGSLGKTRRLQWGGSLTRGAQHQSSSKARVY